LAFLADDAFEVGFALPSVFEHGGQEDEAAAVLLFCGQIDARFLAGLLQEAVGHLDEDAGAVAGIIFAAAGTAVTEVDQDRERVADDGVGFAALDVDDEADAAGVVFILGVVKALLGRKSRGAGLAEVVILH
jgi:hypothetical protein